MGSSSSTSLHVITRKEGYSFSSSESTGLSGSAVGGSLPSIFAVMLHMTLGNHTHTSRYKAAAEELYFLLMGVFLDTPWLAKKSFICLLPPTCIALISFSVHESICTERTKLMWTYAVTWASGRPTPNPRCCPEHSRQINVPYETDAHCGRAAPQSAQTFGSGRGGDNTSFPGSLRSSAKTEDGIRFMVRV